MGRDSRTLVLQYAASAKWRISAFDIQTAFLRGSRQDGRILGMEPPKEMRTAMKLQPWECCELLKSAYGLVNAPLLWYLELKNALINLGMQVSPFDPCIFCMPKANGDGVHGILGIHVDDGLMAGDSEFHNVIGQLEQKYPFGSKSSNDFVFTGIHIHQQDDHSITLDQSKYIEDIPPINIERHRRQDANQSVNETERQGLRGLIGSLQYATTNTRPDLAAKGPWPDTLVADSLLRACSRGLAWEVAGSCLVDVELLESDGFNLYSTDVEEAFPPGSALIRRARHVVLFLGAVLAFICGVWIFDGMLDWMDAGQSQNLAELKSKTGHLEEQVNQLSAKDSNVGPKNDKFYKKYFQTCNFNVGSYVPYIYSGGQQLRLDTGCLFNDVDLGCTFSNQTLGSSYERECVSIPSLSSHDFGDGASTFRCGTDVSDVGEVSTLPSELGGPYAGSSYEWTAKNSEVIFLELWGGGGGGSGSSRVDSAAGTDGAAWICGGGGGAAAAVSLAWKLEVGERYRIEIGKGGTPSGDGSSSRFLQLGPGSSDFRVLASAGGGYGAGGLRRNGLFSPGGRGGTGVALGDADVIPGMDGQSSRANLRLPPDILPITLDTLQSEFNIAHVNSSFSRLPCSGRGPDWKRLAKCQHKQDFFLTCGTNLGCYGVVDSVTPGDEQLPGDEAFDFSGYLLPALELIPISLSPAEVAGGQPPQGSGDVPRVAGQGGNGHCPRVWVKHNRMMIVRTTTGTPGQPGMATIHGCRQMKSEGLFTEMLRSNVPLGSMGFSAAALAFGYGHQWQEMFRILEVIHQQRMAADVFAISLGLGEAEQRGLQEREAQLLGSLSYTVPGVGARDLL
eukprot:symbB.v1.2.025043.t1/scaffold2403.1/size80067/1